MSRIRTWLSTTVAAALVSSVTAVAGGSTPVVQAAASEGWSALGTGIPDGRVFSMAKAADNSLYVGGTFNGAGGAANTRKIARWNPTTPGWEAVGGGVSTGDVYAVAYDAAANDVWIGGNLTAVSGGEARNRLAIWDVSGSASSWVAQAASPSVNAPGNAADGVEEIVVVSSNEVYIGGAFNPGLATEGLVMWNGTNTEAVGGGIGIGGFEIVNGMTAANGGVIVTGQFLEVSNSAVTARRAALWDGSSWSSFGGDSGPGGTVAAVATTSAGVVVGGLFTEVQNAGTPVADTNRLAMWNGTAWVSIGTVDGPVIEELRVIGNYLYAGGEFSSIGGVEANNIARYNLTTRTWQPIVDGCLNGVNGVVRSIVDAGSGAIYVGGGFTEAGGVAGADRIALYTPTTQGCPTDNPPSIGPLPAPSDFRVAGVTPDRVGRINGMQVHLAWDIPAGTGLRQFSVTTKGRVVNGTFTPNPNHGTLSCWARGNTCRIFFPFTSNDRTMNGRQYHQVMYTLQGYGPLGMSQPISIGPIAGLEPQAPSAPRNVRARAGWNEVTVSWDAPTDPGTGGFVTNYLARSSRGDVCITRVTTIPETADARVCTFRKLTPGVDYTFTVEALSLFGWGATSEPTEETTPYFVEVTGTRRQGPWLSLLFGSRATWTGSVSGYPAGTTLTPVYRIGTGSWRRDTGARVRVDESGNFRYRRDFNVLYSRRNLSVRFEVGDPAVCAAVAFPAVPCGTSEVSVIGSLRR